MERIDPPIGPGMTPAIRPAAGPGSTYASRAYASPRHASTTPGTASSDTLARIGPDSFQSGAAGGPSGRVSPGVAQAAAPRKSDALVAARVASGIDFSAGPTAGADASPQGSQTASQTIPLYRHPADRNTVATAVHAGRILDVNG